ncbi:MAG: GntR family transcriptional regulator [Bryobacteraceae bacterium]
MVILIDPYSGVPVYRQLMDQVRFHISSGLLKPGDELPSTRALSAELGLNPMTISKAYSLLEAERVIERRPGLPVVVRTLNGDQLRDRKVDQLRQALAPAVTVHRQLGLGKDEAIDLFRQMVEEESE